MNAVENYGMRYLETKDLDQYNALLRYTFQVTEDGLEGRGDQAVKVPGTGAGRCTGLF